MKSKFVQVRLKLIMKPSDSLSKINTLFKLKSLSTHVTALEFHHNKTAFPNYKAIILRILKFIKYLRNIKKIAGSFHLKYPYLPTKALKVIIIYEYLLQKLKNIKTKNLNFELIVDDNGFREKDREKPYLFSRIFAEILPTQAIIPLTNLRLHLKSFLDKRISFRYFEMLENSLTELTLVLSHGHPNLDEFQALNYLHSLKILKIYIEDFNLWGLKNKNKIGNILCGLPIISLKIKINTLMNQPNLTLSWQILPENLLIEISYLDNLENLTLWIDTNLRLNSNTENELLKNSVYKNYKHKKQFAKLKSLNIRCKFESTIIAIIISLVYYNQINLNNLKVFNLHEGLQYILKTKQNIIFDKMKNLKSFRSINLKINQNKLLLNIDNFFNCIYNLTSLIYLDLRNSIRVNNSIHIFQKSLMILNYLYNLKKLMINWIITGNNNIDNESRFIEWLESNLKYNLSIRDLNMPIIPIQNYDTLCKIIKIMKRNYPNISKLKVIIGASPQKHDILIECLKRNVFVHLFDELYLV